MGPELIVDDPGIAHQHVQGAVGCERQVHRAVQARREGRDLVRMIGVEDLDPALDKIHEEVLTSVLGGEWAAGAVRAEGPAGDRRDLVGMDRRTIARVVRRSLGRRPAIVGAGEALVDLLPGVLAHVVDEDPPRARLHGERERIAQAECPDGAVLAPGRGEEGVIRGDGAVAVDPEQLALEGIEALGRLARRLLADGDVELAVAAEVERAPLVARRDRAP